MTGRKKNWEDMEKFRIYRNRQRKNNYKQTQLYERKRWTDEETEMVLKHEITDRELSKIIHHSVPAIQVHRSRNKKGET